MHRLQTTPSDQRTFRKCKLNGNMKTHTYYTRKLSAVLASCILIVQANAAPSDGLITPYVDDAFTVLLDHFDDASAADILAVENDGAPCGSPRPPANPNYSFGPSYNGLGRAITLSPPDDVPPGSATYLKYPGGQMLSQTDGTLECWLYLTRHGTFSMHQFNYVGECQGNVGGIDVNPTGQLEVTVWYTKFDSFTFNSGQSIVPLNAWTHVAFSWGSGGAKLYMNGVIVGNHPSTGSFADWFGLDSVFLFLGEGNYVDELRISNVQRTSFNLITATVSPTLDIKMFAGVIINGAVGAKYEIQSTPAVGPINWTTLSTLALPSSPYTFIDYRSPTNTQQFYRVLLVNQ